MIISNLISILNFKIEIELLIIIFIEKKVNTSVLNNFCLSFRCVHEYCTSGTDRGVSKVCVALPLVKEWDFRNF